MKSRIFQLAGASTLAIAMAVPAFAADNKNAEKDEIIVTANPLTTSANETLVGVSVMNHEEIGNRMTSSIGELLKTEPGISSTFFGPAASRPVIRGQGGSRIRILDNGIGAIDASSASPDHAVSVEPAMAERVEIIRGSGLLRYGSSGSGGVINVIDGRIPDKVPDKAVEASGRVGYTSVDHGMEAAGGVNYAPVQDGKIVPVFHAEFALRKEGNYSIPGDSQSKYFQAAHPDEADANSHGIMANSGGDSRSGSVGLGLIGSHGHFGVAVKSEHMEYGIPGEAADGQTEPGILRQVWDPSQGSHIELNQTRVDANGELDLDNSLISKVSFFGGLADYKHQEIEETGDLGTTFLNKGWESRVEATHDNGGDYSAAYGFQAQRTDFSAIGEEAFLPETISHQYGMYTFQQFDLGKWHIEGAGRYENTDHSQVAHDVSSSFDGFSVSAGLDRHITDNLKVGGTLFRTERAPTTAELYANGPHLATNQYEVGNPDLGLETALGGEVAIRYSNGGSKATFNLFRTGYDNYIYGERNGQVEDGVPVFVFTGKDAIFQGVEFQGSQELGNWKGADWRATAQVSYVDAYLTTGTVRGLPRIPPLSALVGLEADTGAISTRAEVFWAAKVDAATPFETPTDSYAQVNGSVAWRFDPNNDNLTLRLGVNNLFNVEARQNTSFLKDIAPLPGRNLRIALEVKY